MAMCRAALESPRKSIIFEPYPSVVDPNDPKTLAFNPKVSASHQGVTGSPKDPSDGHPSLAPRAEEELRAAAEGPGQCHVHPGDDPGAWRGPTPPWPHVTSPKVWDPSREWHFGADLHLPVAGWVLGDPRAPPLASARGPTWRSRSRWTSWTPWRIPSCSGKAEGAAALSHCPLSLPLLHIPWDMGWGGGQPGICGTTLSSPLS